ncbi:uncharacterized protein LOC117224089 [Megalopta genalis]|uniref:uncharacterized protein LOC117224089 n=1 Tax=Megalopta genalis TaxID=115081 RepID=UPI003FD0CE46
MIGGIVPKTALHCLLVNAILIAGSPGIYASDLSRNRRDASCPSCSRDSPAALANWDSLPSSRVARHDDAESTLWNSGKGRFQQPKYRTNLFSVNSYNPYYGAARGRGGAEIGRAWGTGRREGSHALQSWDIYPDLAPAPASPFRNIKTSNPPVAPFQPLDPDSSPPFQPLFPDSRAPFQPLRPGSNAPFQPLGRGSNAPFQLLGPDSSAPFQPLRPGSNGPFQPLDPGLNRPFQSLGPGSKGLFQPLGPDSNAPFHPLGPGSKGLFQSLGLGSKGLFQLLGSGFKGPFQPLGPGSNGPFQPLGPGSNGPFQPLGPGSNGPFQPLGPGSNGPFQPLGPGSNGPFQPLGPGSNGPFQPLGPGSNGPFQPLGPGSNGPFQPLGPGSNGPFQPLRPGSNGPFQPLDPGLNGPFQPLRPGSNGPFQPLRPGSNGPLQSLDLGSRAQLRKLDLFDPAEPNLTSVNRGFLNYDPFDPSKSIFEDSNTGTSMVLRADKYDDDDDDSSEEDPVPLYPSDYPRKQFDSRTDVFELRRPTVQLDRTELIGRPSRVYGGPRVMYGGNYRLDRSKESRITDRPSEPQKNQHLGAILSQGLVELLEDQSRDLRVGKPQIDQTRDSRMAQRLSVLPENQFRESRMEQNHNQLQDLRMTHELGHVQGNQLRDSKMADRFRQHQDAQPKDFKMANRFGQGDQFRNLRLADKLIKSQEKPFRTSSVMHVPDTGFTPQDQLSEQDILKIMQQIGAMVTNRSNAVEQKRGQQEVKISSDHTDGSPDSPKKDEAKEKRDTVDEKNVPVNANDGIFLSHIDYDLPEEMTTQTLEIDIMPVTR